MICFKNYLSKLMRPALILSWFAIMLVFLACEKKPSGKNEDSAPEKKQEINTVMLSNESLKNMELKIEVAAIGSLERKLKVPGRITADLNRSAKMSATLEGRIIKLNQDLGDKVVIGAEMGLLETPELLDKPLILKASINGIVTEKQGTVGELIAKGQEIFTLSDPNYLWLIGEVKEQDLSLVHPKQKVNFSVFAYPKEKFTGIIARMGNAVEMDSRTFEIRVEVSNQKRKLKPGMFADIEITTDVLQGALVISDAALQTDGEDQILFVALTENKFEKRKVKLGREQDSRVQIVEGIQAGEKVVTEGSFTLKSEMLKSELGEE